jgi:hypothetical protein
MVQYHCTTLQPARSILRLSLPAFAVRGEPWRALGGRLFSRDSVERWGRRAATSKKLTSEALKGLSMLKAARLQVGGVLKAEP